VQPIPLNLTRSSMKSLYQATWFDTRAFRTARACFFYHLRLRKKDHFNTAMAKTAVRIFRRDSLMTARETVSTALSIHDRRPVHLNHVHGIQSTYQLFCQVRLARDRGGILLL
jgi:hypothetical protein